LDLLDDPATDKNMRSLADQLKDLEQLPSLPDLSEPAQLPDADTGDKSLNPLLFGEDDDDDQPTGELSTTNGRDCDLNAATCRADFAIQRRREQTHMSLDITPSIEPREFDMAKVDEVRIEKLAKAPSRTWSDGDGNVLTDGKLEDYRDGHVFVRTLNGSLRRFAPHNLSDEDWCFVTAWWEIPSECRFENEQYAVRDFRLTTFTWTAPSTCHKPLYFEEVNVERYGHSAGPIVQPLVSGAHFFGNVFMLPYHMGLNPLNECMYTLGHYRPGDCAPWLAPGFPFTTRGFKWEGLVVGAAIALLP